MTRRLLRLLRWRPLSQWAEPHRREAGSGRPTLPVAVVALACAFAFAAHADEAAPVVRIAQAAFVAAPDITPPADSAAWEEVTLPDVWPNARPKFLGNGWYRFDVSLASVPNRNPGLYLATSRTQTELYVNGRYAGASGVIDGVAPDRIGFAQLYVVPTAALHPGVNRLHLRVFRPGAGGGISEIEFGNYTTLYFAWLTRLLYFFASYAVVGVTITTIGVFVLLLWIRRRTQSEYFYFGAGALVWGLHSLFRLMPGQQFPLHFTVIWHFTNLLSVALLTVFCLRFAERRWYGFERMVWAVTLLLVPAFYASAAFGPSLLGYLPELTEVAHVVYNAFVLAALSAVVLRVREHPRFDSWLLLLGALSFSAPRFIPWFGVNDRSSLDAFSLTPGAIFAFMLIAGWILVDRFVRTATDLERLNTQLGLRVEEKSAELRAQLVATELAREEAENANLAKSRFLAAASHDLRQPLHALGLFAAALDEKTHDPEARDLVDHVNQSINALDTLFSSVLDVSKLDAGAVAPAIGNIALQRIFDRLGDQLWPDAEAKMLRLRFVPTRLVVRSDPVLVERILRNLVHNAIRYTERGGVLVGARKRGRRVHLEVWDTGIGIGPEDRERIFEEFYQVGNPERDRTQGLGLGLSIVRRLSDLLGHPLTLQSRPGRGSVFRLSMEAVDAAADIAAASVPATADAAVGTLRGQCVTIIDDEPPVRDGMVALLNSWGCEAIVAGDASEAVSLLETARKTPTLLIVDYRLRDRVVGIDVIGALRARFGDDVPAIIISGESSAAELSRITASGLPMLHKPVPPAKLRSMMFHVLSQTRTLELRPALRAVH